MSNKKSINSKQTLQGLDNLSLGISMVVAIAIGVALGVWLQKLTGSVYMLFGGIVLGVLAAILNVYKAYKRLSKELENCDNKGYMDKDVIKDSGYIDAKDAYANSKSNISFTNEQELKMKIQKIKNKTGKNE